jgi:prepilin-type N-terminal cleavage/methylation domain-containing protein
MAYKIKNKGFTIVELMIAITVFSTAMVLVLAGVILISRQYQQASNRVAIEEATRNIHQQIGDAIRFSGANSIKPLNPATGQWWAMCVGNLMFVYPSNTPFTVDANAFDTSLAEGLYIKQGVSCVEGNVNVSSPLPPLPPIINLLPSGAKVTRFSVNGTTGNITTTFAKSPGDLLNIPSSTDLEPGKVSCNAIITGREFCAAVSMQSTVNGRVN